MLRTRHVLKYIGDNGYSGYIQLALNRGEAYRQLRRKITEAHGGEFRSEKDKIDIDATLELLNRILHHAEIKKQTTPKNFGYPSRIPSASIRK